MKKIFSITALGFAAILSAQISFAGKANAIFPMGSSSWKSVIKQIDPAVDYITFNEAGKKVAGFNVGLSVKISTPTSFFVMPELYFTTFKNKFEFEESDIDLEARTNRLDLPVLLGYNLLGETLGIFIGPVASYNITSEKDFEGFQEKIKNQFTVGYQFGAQAQISKLIVNARFEGAFGKDTRSFLDKVSGGNYEVQYDNRPSLFIIGLGYKF
ncbi:MAG: PorT family protein [Flavobacteriaceae bacterium]|jgi:hypothetical protein|nr:PorT family protein [Flavobacteriaceae bacterium]